MVNCAVANCSNDSRHTHEVIYHCFPKDVLLAKEWETKCHRQDQVNIKCARICSDHFESVTDYEDDMKNRLLGLKERKILKKNAVPSLNIPSSKVASDSNRDDRYQKRNIRKAALNHLQTLSPKKSRLEPSTGSSEYVNIVQESEETSVVSEVHCLKCDERKTQIDLLNKKVNILEGNVKTLQSNNKLLKNKVRRLMRKKVTVPLRTKTDHKSRIISNKCCTFLRNMTNIFTENQIRAVISQKKKMIWSSEDISRAIAIRAISRKSFDFWRERIGIPLPSPATLKRWCSGFQCRPGILHNVLQLMSDNSENISSLEKSCVLSFDEMSIDSRLNYHPGMDKVFGPHSKVQVVLARGLTAPWKQPVYYNFDTTMNKTLLFDIIVHIERTGILVSAIVSDLGGCNLLWKELAISPENSSFVHPTDPCRKVWIFADMPHYLKLLRNHLLDTGLVLKDGTVINKDLLIEVLNKDGKEVKLCYKLKPEFLFLKGNDRQKVGPAKTLFSRTVAKAILTLTGNEKASEFFQLIDSFCDIMNSNSPHSSSSHPMKTPFGLNSCMSEQLQVLSDVKDAIFHMRVSGKKHLLPFQKGILVSINSLLGLHEEIKRNGLTYIMTCRLTQDVLESLFSQIRGLGHFYDHPTPTDFIFRLRRLLLSNKLPLPSNKTNVTEDKDYQLKPYLTADMLQSAFGIDEVNVIASENNATLNSVLPDEDDELRPMEGIEDANQEDLKSWAESEALNYIAGYIAHKVKEKDSSLGQKTKNLGDETNTWVGILSYGGLTEPSEEWKKTIQMFEVEFKTMHGNSIDKEEQVIQRFKTLLETKFSNVCSEAIKLYARVRTFVRLRSLNRGQRAEFLRNSAKKNVKWMKSSRKQLH